MTTMIETRDPVREQRDRARAKGNAIRTRRGEIRRQLHGQRGFARTAMLATVIEANEPAVHKVELIDAVRWAWRIHRNTVLEALDVTGASPLRRLGELTPRQRALLAGFLRDLAAVGARR